MYLKEHEGRALFARYGIPVPRAFLMHRGANADALLHQNFSEAEMPRELVLKAQLLEGKRGKSGGVVFSNPEKLKEDAAGLMKKSFHGQAFDEILVEEKLDVASELYLSITVDREQRCPMIIVSDAGGIDIEETAEENPEKIGETPISGDLFPFALFGKTLSQLGFETTLHSKISDVAEKLLTLIMKEDALLAEINPLILTKDGKLFAADAKIIIDDSALFRHPDVASLKGRCMSELEKHAAEKDLSYVELDGDVAIIGNGAGLVMATLDAVESYGARPANFCDIGGGATPEMMEAAMETVMKKSSVKILFINIFGGITHCDDIARGLVQSISTLNVRIPIIVRMVGTNQAAARDILSQNGIQALTSFEEAAKKVSSFV